MCVGGIKTVHLKMTNYIISGHSEATKGFVCPLGYCINLTFIAGGGQVSSGDQGQSASSAPETDSSRRLFAKVMSTAPGQLESTWGLR